MTEASHLCFEVPAEAVVAVAGIALVLSDPSVLVVAGCQSSAVWIQRIVHHRLHDVATRTAADFVDSFEGVIVCNKHRSRRKYYQADERQEPGKGKCRNTRDDQVDLFDPGLRLIEARPRNPYAADYAENAHQRPQHHHDLPEINIHTVTFLTDTAVTLNSGSFEV